MAMARAQRSNPELNHIELIHPHLHSTSGKFHCQCEIAPSFVTLLRELTDLLSLQHSDDTPEYGLLITTWYVGPGVNRGIRNLTQVMPSVSESQITKHMGC